MSTSFLRSRFVNWMCRSLIGHIVLAELTLGLGVFVVFCAKAYSDGDLTARFVVVMAAVCALAGLVWGVLFWFGLSRPLLVQRGKLPRR